MLKNILVIGGAGFIGSHTVVELFRSGYRPVIVDNFSNSEPSVIERLKKVTTQDINYFDLDYRDSVGLKKVIKDNKIDGIIHFAAFKAVAESVEKPLKYYDNNVSGFISLLEIVEQFSIKHFVFSSSAAVYGNPPTDKVTENTICRPTSPYGWTKYIDEIILKDFCAAYSELKATALRYFNVVGAHPSALIGELPKGKPQNLLPIIVKATSKQIPPLTVYGADYDTPDGTCLRDYIHVVDLASAHIKALDYVQKSAAGFDVFNIGTGKPTSVLDLIKTFELVNKIKVPYKIGARRAGDPTAYYASALKANNVLHWKATKTISNAVSDAWRWQQALLS